MEKTPDFSQALATGTSLALKEKSGSARATKIALEAAFHYCRFMKRRLAAYRALIFLVLSWLCAGCWDPWTGKNGPADEEKDVDIIRGRNLVRSLDYTNAAEAFEGALRTNPRNASAHFELCVLNEQRFNDFPAAIYHGERFLKLRPKSEQTNIVANLVTSSLRQLATSVPVGAVTPSLQRDYERILSENGRLKLQIEVLGQQLAQANNRPAAAPDPPAPAPGNPSVEPPKANPTPGKPSPPSGGLVKTNPPGANRANPPSATGRAAGGSKSRLPAPVVAYNPPSVRSKLPVASARAPVKTPARSLSPASSGGSLRYHAVRRGDTWARICRIYNVTPDALQRANPTLSSGQIASGLAVRIP